MFLVFVDGHACPERIRMALPSTDVDWPLSILTAVGTFSSEGYKEPLRVGERASARVPFRPEAAVRERRLPAMRLA